MQQLFTIKELSEGNFFPFKERKIRQLLKSGRLKSLREGNTVIITETAVKDYLKSLQANTYV